MGIPGGTRTRACSIRNRASRPMGGDMAARRGIEPRASGLEDPSLNPAGKPQDHGARAGSRTLAERGCNSPSAPGCLVRGPGCRSRTCVSRVKASRRSRWTQPRSGPTPGIGPGPPRYQRGAPPLCYVGKTPSLASPTGPPSSLSTSMKLGDRRDLHPRRLRHNQASWLLEDGHSRSGWTRTINQALIGHPFCF